MGGKTSTSTSSVQVPADVLARYNSVNATAEKAASQPFQSYSSDPSAFVAPLSATQQAGIQNTNNSTGQAQPYYQAATGQLLGAQGSAAPMYQQAQGSLQSGLAAANPLNNQATGLAKAGSGAVNPTQIGESQINQFMNPYLHDVVGAESGLLNQNNQQAMAGQLGNAITSGAFGGDRSGIAAANLSQQQNLANANIYSGLLNQGYSSALGAAQQQQGVNLGAQEQNRAASQWGSGQLANLSQMEYGQGLGASQQEAALGQGLYGMGANTANSLAGLGAGAQSANLQGATAQLSAGQQEQSTQQAGLTSLYNQFLQQQAYPFQTSQFLANVAEGTGSLSGSTTSTTQPTGLFGNLLSDRRAKEDIREVGKAKNGLKVYTFKYKGDPEKVTHLGFMADEVEKKHPEAVGLAGGLKTVDYARAARADGGGLVFDPNAGEYGLGAAGMPGRSTYVPAPTQGHARTIAFQHSPPAPRSSGITDVADQYKAAKGLYNDGSELWKDGKSVVSGLGGGNLSHGGLALARDDGGGINDAYSHETPDDLLRKQAALHAEAMQADHAPNSAGNGPVSGALAAQNSQPKYSLGSTPDHGSHSSGSGGGLGDLATLGTMASDVAPYALALFGLKAGGLVREHHADGDVVGNTLNSDEFGRPLGDVAPDAPDLGGLKGPPPGARPEAPAAPVQHKPYRQRPVYAEDVAPMPPERPAGLGGATPEAVAAQPGLAAPSTPMFHYRPNGRMGPDRIADNSDYAAGLSPSDRAMTGLVAPGTDTASFLINRESGGKFNARNPASSAYGLGQFTPDTAKTVSYRHPDLPSLASFYSSDPAVSVPAQKAYINAHAADQASVLQANGIDPTPQNIHVNWFLGEAGGPAFLKGMAKDPNTPGVSLARPEQVAANKTIFYNPDGTAKTAAQVYASLNGGAAGSGAGAPQPQQPGLMGSLGSFLHGQPDGQSSPNGGQGERALMAVLSGLGAVGSYKGQSPLGAILQGLGAGAHGWMDSGKQQADIANTQASTGLTGAETGRTNVNAARDSILPESQMYIGPDGRVHYIDKNIAGRGLPLLGGKPNASTTEAPVSGANQPPPIQKPELTGIGYDKSKAQNEILVGPQSRPDIEQSAAYQAATQQAGAKAQLDIGNSRRLMNDLVHAYPDAGLSAPGAGFDSRANAVGALNTAARAFGLGEGVFGNADKGQVLTEKINRLQAAMTQQGAGDHTLGALEMYKGINATLDQPPEASAEIASQLMADKMRAKDQWMHMEKFKSDSPGNTVRGAADDFAKNNPAEKYTKEANEIKGLMLKKGIGSYIDKLTSGKYSAEAIAKSLQQHGYDPNLARYFATGQQ